MSFELPSIRARLILGVAVVLVAFMAMAGVALQTAHADGVRAAHYARLQSTVYLLLAGAELTPQAVWSCPPSLPNRACRCRAPACMRAL